MAYGQVIYLLHGTPASGFGTAGAVVHVGDHIYDADSLIPGGGACIPAGNCSHLHFEVRLSTDTPYSTSPFDDINPERWFAGNICTSVSWQPPSSPVVLGSSIILSAGSSGCPNPSYQFMIQRPGQAWTVLQGYQANPTFTWDSTNQPPGNYGFGVWVHDQSNPDAKSFDTNSGSRVTVNPTCPSVTSVPSPSSPQSIDTTIYVYGSVSDPTCTAPEFKFLTRASTSSTWIVLKDWTPYGNPNYYVATWNTSAFVGPSTYYLGVWVRQHNVPGAYIDSASGDRFDAANSAAFTLNPDTCSSVTISGQPTSVAHGSGESVTFTAVASCPHPNQSDQRVPSYKFVMRPASQNTWQTVQEYSTSNVYYWNSAGAAQGTVYFGVWVQDASSSNAYDALNSIAYQVT
jgi:hypothetical protein